MIFNGKTSLISPKLTESRRHAQFYLRGCLLKVKNSRTFKCWTPIMSITHTMYNKHLKSMEGKQCWQYQDRFSGNITKQFVNSISVKWHWEKDFDWICDEVSWKDILHWKVLHQVRFCGVIQVEKNLLVLSNKCWQISIKNARHL